MIGTSVPGRDKNNHHLPSYTTSPMSEYIGSKIYASLEIPVHEVILGKREGKVVVGCKDFTVNDQLMDFAAIKNTIDEDCLAEGSSSSDRGEMLSDALKVIEEAEVFTPFVNDVKKRFWDMFVTDAFILNNDKKNSKNCGRTEHPARSRKIGSASEYSDLASRFSYNRTFFQISRSAETA